MASKTTIANLALRHLSHTQQISNIETEDSGAAQACEAFYEISLKSVLAAAKWPFASKTQYLGLVEENPNLQWGYSYQYPNDCLSIHFVSSGTLYTYPTQSKLYTLGESPSGTLIYSNLPELEITYTAFIENVEIFPSDFLMAFSYLLAAMIAPSVTAGDPFKLGDRSMAMYQTLVADAKVRALNEVSNRPVAASELVTARD